VSLIKTLFCSVKIRWKNVDSSASAGLDALDKLTCCRCFRRPVRHVGIRQSAVFVTVVVAYPVNDSFAVTSVSSVRCQATTCLPMGPKFRCVQSTPAEMQSISENDFECFGITGVNAPGTMLPDSGSARIRFPVRGLLGSVGSFRRSLYTGRLHSTDPLGAHLDYSRIANHVFTKPRQDESIALYQSAKSRSRFEPVRLATTRAPLFMTTSRRDAS